MMHRCRVWIASGLVTLAEWVWPSVITPHVPAALLARAVALTREQDTNWPERSGEAKRHQCLAALIKAFPDESKRVISRAIEDAL